MGVEIVLAVDTSTSISQKEHEAQIEGIAKTFENDEILRIIENIPTGRIAVALMLWAGEDQQLMAVPWQEISDRASAERFAKLVRSNQKKPWAGLLYTAIGNAMQTAANAFDENQIDGYRKIIDISGDDPNNQGAEPGLVRALLVAQGITINGLPILADRPDQESREDLVDYFVENIIGGPFSFVSPAVSFSHYSEAFSKKFKTEISGNGYPDNLATDRYSIQSLLLRN